MYYSTVCTKVKRMWGSIYSYCSIVCISVEGQWRFYLQLLQYCQYQEREEIVVVPASTVVLLLAR
jgi:hypothetical protein